MRRIHKTIAAAVIAISGAMIGPALAQDQPSQPGW